MKITFRIHYKTAMGESLMLEVRGEKPLTLELTTKDGNLWQGELSYRMTKANERIEYNYSVVGAQGCLRTEMLSVPHTIELDRERKMGYVVDDIWRNLPAQNCRYSAAFSSTKPFLLPPAKVKGRSFTLRCLSPALSCEGLRLGVVGSSPALGQWGAHWPVSMSEIAPNMWSVTLPIDSAIVEYKFVAINIATGALVEWEGGDNRRLTLASVAPDVAFVVPEAEVVFSRGDIRLAGSAIPVFSLRSQGGCGVGDFGDLKNYIVWAAKTQQRVVQILPINDTTISNTWQDSYPYNSISIYAFHPMYIDLRCLPSLKSKTAMVEYERERAQINALEVVDYERVNTLKRSYLRAIFEQVGAKTLASRDFKTFFAQNSHWLQPYAAFSFMRDEEGTPNFNLWSRYSVYNKEEIAALCSADSPAYNSVAFYYYVQYLLHTQLLEAANEARSLGVILKGDIPIGISRESVEAWVEPHYFNMNGQAGAPPDAFSVKGQNWGFPTYNWEVMQKDNYLWWRRRFAKMSEYFTAYRIDHILGFFRIWEIPLHSVHGLLGQFAPAMPMSEEEIRSWGLDFQRPFMTEPFINDQILWDVFGDKADYVRQTFVIHSHHDIYSMRDEFTTQRAVEAHFAGRDDEESTNLKEGLYSLISNVLFVADRHDESKYHPRISAQNDLLFRQLSPSERDAFNRLYNHYYYERHNDFWYHQAMQKLPVLTLSTSMLVCGEDLGMVPDCVAPVMEQLQIVSLEIERMPKDPSQEFGHPSQYPTSSVCTIGTHDMSTLRGWWEEDRALTERYYHHELCRWGTPPTEATAPLCNHIVERHLQSPSMLAVLTWQDWVATNEELRNPNIEGERINVPANPRHYWRWRMHISLEELAAHRELNRQIEHLITSAKR